MAWRRTPGGLELAALNLDSGLTTGYSTHYLRVGVLLGARWDVGPDGVPTLRARAETETGSWPRQLLKSAGEVYNQPERARPGDRLRAICHPSDGARG